jgi:hypothetical protein
MKCVPFALSYLTGKPADEVLSLLQEDGGYSARKKSFPRTVYIPLLEMLGAKITARVVEPHMTVKRWASILAKRGDRAPWLIRVSGHVVVYRDGTLYDNGDPSGTGKAMDLNGKCRVTHAWQVAA